MKQPSVRPPLFVYAIILGFTAFLWVIGVGRIQDSNRIKAWPQAEGKVTRSEITERTVRERSKNDSSTREKTVYRCQPQYSYQVNGTDFENNTVSLEDQDGSLGRAEDIQDCYPAGAQVMVYANPENPSESYLDPSLSFRSYGILALAGIFSLTFVYMVFKGFFG